MKLGALPDTHPLAPSLQTRDYLLVILFQYIMATFLRVRRPSRLRRVAVPRVARRSRWGSRSGQYFRPGDCGAGGEATGVRGIREGVTDVFVAGYLCVNAARGNRARMEYKVAANRRRRRRRPHGGHVALVFDFMRDDRLAAGASRFLRR